MLLGNHDTIKNLLINNWLVKRKFKIVEKLQLKAKSLIDDNILKIY